MTHRPVVDDGWYEDFTKIFMVLITFTVLKQRVIL